MTSTTAHMYSTANDLFKAQYPKYLRWSLIIALVVTILFFLFSPKVEIQPYRIYNEEMQIQDIQQETFEAPEEEKVAPKPVQEITAVPDEEADEDMDIADTLIDSTDMLDDFDYSDDGGGGYTVDQVKPRITYFHKPDYPEMARMSRLEGTVMVKVQVGTDGNVIQAVIVQSVHPMLDRKALEAARRCKFTPGTQQGVPVKCWMGLPFAFRLSS